MFQGARFLFIFILAILSFGCKEAPRQRQRAPEPPKPAQSLSFNDFNESGVSTDNNKKSQPTHPIIDLNTTLYPSENTNSVLAVLDRCTLSQFPSPDPEKIIRVSISMRGIPKSQAEDIEEQIWKLLTERAPHPWNLRKASAIDKHETPWATLNIDLRRQTTKLRRSSKNAPLRYDNHDTFSVSMTLPQGMKSSWSSWKYQRTDEVSAANEKTVRSQFWKNLYRDLPELVIYDPEAIALWMRAQGLLSLVLDNELARTSVPKHRVFNTGCLLSRETPQTHMLRMIQSPWAVPQTLEIPEILDMACTRDAIYAVSPETPVRTALYYQPLNAQHAWKSQITFSDSIPQNGFKLHRDDDLICLYSGVSQSARSTEIQCIDSKSGLMRWQTRRVQSPLRGIAFSDEQIAIATDRAVFSIMRDGTPREATPIQASSKIRENLSCQLQNRLVFSTGTGQFRAWNMTTHAFDWQTTVFESNFIHCGLKNTLLISDSGGYILAFDVENNRPLWKYRAASKPLDVLSNGEFIYFLMPRAVIALERATGKIRAQIPLPWFAEQWIQAGPKLYFDTQDAIYAWR